MKHLSTLVLLASVLALSGCHGVQPIQPDSPRLALGVKMQDVTFHSAALKRDMPYRVFLPAKLAPGEKLPVVYLLHGGNGTFKDWSNNSDAAQYAAKGLILVMPEGAFSYYMNSVENPKERYQDYLVNDLIADVETRFPAARDRKHRAIVGISMGGFAAIKLALTRPELFVFVGALSPSVDAARRPFNIKHTDEWWRFRTIFGPRGSRARQSSDPFVLIKTADRALTPYIYLTAGDSEPLLEPNRRFAAQLLQRHFSSEFHIRPGGHDWTEWNAQIPGCFERLFEYLPPGPAN